LSQFQVLKGNHMKLHLNLRVSVALVQASIVQVKHEENLKVHYTHAKPLNASYELQT